MVVQSAVLSSLQLLCFALLLLCVLIVPDKAREGLYTFASVYVYWMERMNANSGHWHKGRGWGFPTLSQHKCDDALGEPPHANTMVKTRVKFCTKTSLGIKLSITYHGNNDSWQLHQHPSGYQIGYHSWPSCQINIQFLIYITVVIKKKPRLLLYVTHGFQFFF